MAYSPSLTLSFPRVINFKFPLQPHQKYYITQYEELGVSSLSRIKDDHTSNSHCITYTFIFKGWENVVFSTPLLNSPRFVHSRLHGLGRQFRTTSGRRTPFTLPDVGHPPVTAACSKTSRGVILQGPGAPGPSVPADVARSSEDPAEEGRQLPAPAVATGCYRQEA